MKKLLYLFDTDALPSVFDSVLGYDGGADHVTQIGGVNSDNYRSLVEGAIFTRAPKDKKNTAIFIGGSNLIAGQNLFKEVHNLFFQNFRVSIMLDSNGCNTTAAAGVALLNSVTSLKGKTAVVLAGTGPVGQRAAVLLAKSGANVRLTSRKQYRSEEACDEMSSRFGVSLIPMQARDTETTNAAMEGAHVVFGAAKADIQLLEASQWQHHPTLEYMADVGTAQIAGFEGIDMMDKNIERHGKIVFGGIGIGAFKLKLHRACIAKLFETNDQIFDAEAIYEIAKKML